MALRRLVIRSDTGARPVRKEISAQLLTETELWQFSDMHAIRRQPSSFSRDTASSNGRRTFPPKHFSLTFLTLRTPPPPPPLVHDG